MPAALNAIEIINYTYFSKIAQKATHAKQPTYAIQIHGSGIPNKDI